jgi:hypothetical protein
MNFGGSNYVIIQKLITYLQVIELLVKMGNVFFVVKIALGIGKFLDSKSKYTILCIGRTGFNEDVVSMHTYSSSINYLIIPKTLFTSIFKCFFSNVSYKDIHTKYYERDDLKVPRDKYRRYINKFLNMLFKDKKFSAILSGNYVYAWQQEIAAACLAKEVPFIVLHKEGMTTKNNYNDLVKTYTNNKFIGSKMLVYNQNIKKAFLKSKIKGLDADIVKVTGAPRLDRYFKIGQKGKNIVFFSFYLKDKIRHVNLTYGQKKECLEIAKNFHIEIMKIALSDKNSSIIIKTKEGSKYYQYVREIARENDFLNIKNLLITSKGDSFDFINDSSCVIGFNSTTLVEGVIARKTIISPNFSKYGILDFFEKYPELVNYANESNGIKTSVQIPEKHQKKIENIRKNFLKEFIDNDDGKSSKLSEKIILNLLRK